MTLIDYSCFYFNMIFYYSSQEMNQLQKDSKIRNEIDFNMKNINSKQESADKL